MGRLTFQLLDFDGDRAQTSVYAADGTQATYDADVTAATAFIAAIEGITLGAITFWAWEAERNEASPANPANPAAQANYQAVAVATDNVTGEEFRARIPTPDHSLFTVVAGGLATVDLSAGAGLAFKTAWDGFVQSPAGNLSTLNQVYLRE